MIFCSRCGTYSKGVGSCPRCQGDLLQFGHETFMASPLMAAAGATMTVAAAAMPDAPSLKPPLSFMGGRLNRQRYIARVFLISIGTMAASVLMPGKDTGTGVLLVLAINLFAMIFGVAQAVKRLHDLDRSGWHYFLLLVPIYNLVLAVRILFQKGSDGPNRFGIDPLTY